MKKKIILSKCVFCSPFCGHPACLLILVHLFLLPQGNGVPPHFAPTRQQSFYVPEGTLSAHPLEPQTFSAGAIRNSDSMRHWLHFVETNLFISIHLIISLKISKYCWSNTKNKNIHQGSKDISSIWFRIEIHVKICVKHLAALQSVLMLSLQLIKGNTESLLLLRWNSWVRLLQQGASGLCNLQKLCLLILELLKLCLQIEYSGATYAERQRCLNWH